MKKFIVVFLVFSLLFTALPLNTFAQCNEAQADAERDVSAILWIGIGFLLGPVGVLIGYMVAPSPPASRIMGKSSNYVMQYTSCYQDKAKSVQGINSIIGCAISGVLVIVYYIWAMSVVTAAATSIY